MLKHFVHLGNQVYIRADEILCLCPISYVSKDIAEKALNLSTGTKRTFIITKSGQHFASSIRYVTLNERLEQALSGKE